MDYRRERIHHICDEIDELEEDIQRLKREHRQLLEEIKQNELDCNSK